MNKSLKVRAGKSWHRSCFTSKWISPYWVEFVLTGRRAIITLVAVLLFGVRSMAGTPTPRISAEVVRLADTAHLEFKGLKSWTYDVRRDGSKTVNLTISAIDDASVAKLQAFSDPLIDTVKVNKSGPDGSYVISFILTDQDIETFDYLTDDPSRLIIDFYHKPAATAQEEVKPPQDAMTEGQAKTAAMPKRSKRPKTGQHKTAKNGDYQEVAKGDRRPAGDEFLSVEAQPSEEKSNPLRFGVFDGGDENYDRFRIKDYEIRDEAIIASKYNVYLPFPMLKMKVSQLGELMERQPEYVINPKDTRENKEARLLLALFERKRFGVFQKTYDYFTKKYPDSEYTEILKNLMAQIYLERWREEANSPDFDKARALYSELVQKFPSSPLRKHNHLILGYALMERGDALSTLQIFTDFIKSYPGAPEIPQVRKARAEAFMILRKFDDATAEYQEIVKSYPKTEYAYEARYRLGDVQFAKGDYGKAIQEYEGAIKDLPKDLKVYPNASFNMAESRFWQKDYKKSLNDYVQFVNLFPTNDYGGYALTRIGELLGILGADQRRVMGAFLESYFRFPNNPGAKVARLRMLSQQMRSMKAAELKKALEEIESTKLDLPGIKEFTTLMVAEGLSGRGEYISALDRLISYYQKNPSSENLGSFKGRILRNISNQLMSEIESDRFLDALEFYSKYSATWLKNSDRIDIPFFVARAYESAGVYGKAQNMYQESLAKRKSLMGSSDEKERLVQEHLPSVNTLLLRLAATQTEERDFISAYRDLKTIGAGKDLSEKETVERVTLSARIAEERNDHDRAKQALEELAKHWQGDPALLAPVNLKLAQTHLKLGHAEQAENYANKVLESGSASEKIGDQTIADAMRVKGDALLSQKKAIAAVETYQALLEKYESKFPLAKVRYKAGEILFDRGDAKGASEVWAPLQGTPNEFLWKVGQEKLADVKWQDDYTKYMNRIPAAVTAKKGN